MSVEFKFIKPNGHYNTGDIAIIDEATAKYYKALNIGDVYVEKKEVKLEKEVELEKEVKPKKEVKSTKK